MKHVLPPVCWLAVIALGACEGPKEAERVPLTDLEINSAKRQCVSVAVLQQVPQDAAKEICDCTVDALIADGSMDAGAMPSDAEQQRALDACIAKHEPNR